MLSFPSAVLAELQAGRNVVTRALAWIEARDRATGDPAPVGLWSGDDAQQFTIDGEARTYYGPAFGPLPPITGGVGLGVRQLRYPMPRLAPEARAILRTYDAGGAPVAIHFAYFRADTRALIDVQRVWRGEIDGLPETIGADGGESAVSVVLVSAARELTRTLTLYHADVDQQARSSGDMGRQYAASQRAVFWGQKRVSASDTKSGDALNGWGNWQ